MERLWGQSVRPWLFFIVKKVTANPKEWLASNFFVTTSCLNYTSKSQE